MEPVPGEFIIVLFMSQGEEELQSLSGGGSYFEAAFLPLLSSSSNKTLKMAEMQYVTVLLIFILVELFRAIRIQFDVEKKNLAQLKPKRESLA